MAKNYQKALLQIFILAILFTSAGTFVLWDYYRVDRDFSKLKALLQDTRYRAIAKNELSAARFIGKQVVITGGEPGKVIKTLNIPTLDEVNYDTTLGDNMIVFTGHGTSAYNKRIHGGNLSLKSWFGFRKNIAVDCTGLVTEGVYPAE